MAIWLGFKILQHELKNCDLTLHSCSLKLNDFINLINDIQITPNLLINN